MTKKERPVWSYHFGDPLSLIVMNQYVLLNPTYWRQVPAGTRPTGYRYDFPRVLVGAGPTFVLRKPAG